MISAGVLIIALVVAQVYLRVRRGKKPPAPRTKGRHQPQAAFVRRVIEEFGSPWVFGISVVLAAIVFAGLWAAFYSSFFTNAKGISDSFKTFEVWTKTGTVAHVHPFFTYAYWLVLREGPLLFLGALGAVFAVLK